MPGIAAMALFAAVTSNAVVLAPVANMYSDPGDSAVVSQAILGTNVAVLEERQDWFKIRTPDDYTGWVNRSGLLVRGPYGGSGKVAQVTSLYAHIYREPDLTRHAPLITVPFETRLEAAPDRTEGERWIGVRLPDGRDGWVQAGDVAFDRKALNQQDILALAQRFQGLPYTWGGASTFGYDCSGFMQMLQRQRGLGMPRDAHPQSNWSGSAPVTREQLAPGDLLYFGKSASRVTHTGMYLGNGKFISATTYRVPTVRIDDLSDPYWSSLLVGMRRVK